MGGGSTVILADVLDGLLDLAGDLVNSFLGEVFERDLK